MCIRDRFQVTDRLAQPDRPDEIGRARFEFQRKRRIGRPPERHPIHHIAAVEERRHRIEQFAPPVEHADTGRAVELVSRKGIEVAPQRRDIRAAEAFKTGRWKLVASPIYLAMAGVALWMLPFNTRFQTSDNVYYNELQANGLYKFYEAFLKNELDYMQFYRTLPEDRAAALVHDEYRSEGQNHRYITSPNEERHPNIVPVSYTHLTLPTN